LLLTPFNSADGKPAVTHYEVRERMRDAAECTFVLETGRTHQIRVQLSYIHHPILGVSIYGGESGLAERQMLHAFRLSFKHPKTGITRSFYAAPSRTERVSLVVGGTGGNTIVVANVHRGDALALTGYGARYGGAGQAAAAVSAALASGNSTITLKDGTSITFAGNVQAWRVASS